MAITLTDDQQSAYGAIVTLITSDQKELVIDGYAGTGKTTLIKTFLDEWPKVVALSAGAIKPIDIHLTATTNKAADALASATGCETQTIHSLLGLRVVKTGYNESKLVQSNMPILDGLVIIDESSFIDDSLLTVIRKNAKHFKILFLGDPCQLKPVGSDKTPVFDAGITTTKLSKIVRQSDTSPIQQLSRDLRAHVAGADIPQININGNDLVYLDREEFTQELISACRASGTVRALAWTNERAIAYNQAVATALSGSGDIKLGDVVIVNKMVQKRGYYKLSTDCTVDVTGIGQWETDGYGLESRSIELNGFINIRQAKSLAELNKATKDAYDSDHYSSKVKALENEYVDLRLMYASTVNKSQGSTYDTVFIDLDDIGRCRDKDQVRRMLYVAVSRARHKVVFTGDI